MSERRYPTRQDAPIATIVAGSREITNAATVFPILNACPWNIGKVISGGAKGVDTLGELWAELNHIPVERFEADWTKHGKGAGPIRNKLMADRAKALGGGLILIWFGDSKGSQNMLVTAIFAGIWLHDVRLPKPPGMQ